MQSLQYLNDKETHPAQAHSTPVISVCWVPSSSSSTGVILSGDCSGTIKVFDGHTARAFANVPKAHSNAVHCITANSAGTRALSSAIDGTITSWNIEPFRASTPITNGNTEENEDAPLPLPVSDPSALIVGQIQSLPSSSAGEAKLSEAWRTTLHPTLPFFASVGAGATISLHALPTDNDTTTLGTTLSIAAPPANLAKQKDLFGLSLAFNASGTLLAVGTNRGQVNLYSCAISSSQPELKLRITIAVHAAPIRALSFTPHLLLVGADDRTITVHDVKPLLTTSQLSDTQADEVREGNTVASLTGHKGWVTGLAALPGVESVFASIGADKSIKFWDLQSATKNTPVFNTTEMKSVHAFAFQPPASGVDEEGKTEAEGGAAAATTSMTRFVTASEDGRLRWYRGAGLG